MKFTTAWANVLSQNISLKVATLFLLISSLTFALTTVKLALRNPLIIERACESKILKPQSTERSSQEIESFIKEALFMRFDTVANANDNYFSQDEQTARKTEKKELLQRNIQQRLLVNSLKTEGNQVTVDCDRLIQIGAIKSVVSVTLLVQIATDSRSEFNPYGLAITTIAVAKKEDVK
jgi:hypothetical protein